MAVMVSMGLGKAFSLLCSKQRQKLKLVHFAAQPVTSMDGWLVGWVRVLTLAETDADAEDGDGESCEISRLLFND